MQGPSPVVSNTTPLIALVGVGLLDVLEPLYGQIWIPEAVFNEYEAGRSSHLGNPDLRNLPWIPVHSMVPHPSVPITLDRGEIATLSLALTVSPRFVLIDEQRARRIALRLGLPLAGSLSVLLEAKKLGHIAQVAPIVDQMIAQGRRISARFRMAVLSEAGE